MTKKKSKRLLCLVLALALVFAFNITPAFAFTDAATVAGSEVTDDGTDNTTELNTTSGSVASIGDTTYKTLAEAFAAAISGETITMEAEAAVDSTISVSTNVTLDLNGQTITASTTLFKVTSTGTLTVCDSGTGGTITISSDSDVYFVNGAGADANVAVEGGTINVTSTGAKAVLIWNSSVNITGGTFTVSGSSNAHGIYAKSGETHTSTISGDDVKLTVTSDGSAVAAANLVSGSVTITGGTYNVSPTASLLEDGYDVTDNDDGTYTVVNKTIKVTTGNDTTTYTSIYEALKAANNAESAATITLYSDVEFISSLTFSNTDGITFDLNGHTMTTSDSFTGQVVFNLSSSFTLIDSSDESTGSIVVSNSVSTTVFSNASTFNFEGGTINFTSGYSGNTAVIKNASGAILNVTGDAAITATQNTANSMYAVQDSSGTITFNTTGIISVTSAGNAYGVNGSGASTTLTLTTVIMNVTTSGSSTEAAGIWNVYLKEMAGGTIIVTAESGKAYGIYAKADSSSTKSAISGGTVTVSGSTESCISGSVSLVGGTYSHSNVSSLVADGYAVYANADGTYTVAGSDAGVAQIGSTQYLTLADAVVAATSGDTVTLLQDVDLGSSYVTIDKDITLDLNGNDITSTASCALYITSTVTLTDSSDEPGTISDESTSSVAPVYGTNSSNITVEKINIISYYDAYAGIYTSGTLTVTSGSLYGWSGIYAAAGATVTVNGGTITGYASGVYNNGATVIINSGTLTYDADGTYYAAHAGVSVFGNSTLTVNGGTIAGYAYGIASNGSSSNATIIVNDGTISGKWGMYLPATSSTTTINGGTITGSSTGIEIRAGVLNVYSGTISGSSSADDFEYTSNGSGTTVAGAGIAISQHTTNDTVTVNITGGTISGYYGVYEWNAYNSNTSAVSLSISGDGTTVTATGSDGEAVYSKSVSESTNDITTVAISGGTYSTAVAAEYCADGYVPTSSTDEETGLTTYGVTEFYLGVSSDSSKSVSASIASGYGESTMYALVSSDNISSYSTTAYPTTDLTFTDDDGKEHTYIFAGWYEDSEGATACTSIPTTDAYAKFVDSDALSIACVYTPASLSTKDDAALRFISSDYGDTNGLYFIINGTTYTITKDYTSITMSSVSTKFEPSYFSSISQYVFTYGIYSSDTSFSVQAGWQTLDGTTVYGTAYSFDANSYIESTSAVILPSTIS